MAVPLPGGRPGGQRGKLTTVVGAVRCRPWLLACPELSASSLPPPSPGRAMGMRVSHWRVRNKSCIQCGSSEPRNSKSKPWRGGGAGVGCLFPSIMVKRPEAASPVLGSQLAAASPSLPVDFTDWGKGCEKESRTSHENIKNVRQPQPRPPTLGGHRKEIIPNTQWRTRTQPCPPRSGPPAVAGTRKQPPVQPQGNGSGDRGPPRWTEYHAAL